MLTIHKGLSDDLFQGQDSSVSVFSLCASVVNYMAFFFFFFFFAPHHSFFWCLRRVKLRDCGISLVYLLIFLRMPLGITKKCLYNSDPLEPHFYVVKLGFKGVYVIFLISAQDIDYGYSLELPR